LRHTEVVLTAEEVACITAGFVPLQELCAAHGRSENCLAAIRPHR
jgi:hypothetical protein